MVHIDVEAVATSRDLGNHPCMVTMDYSGPDTSVLAIAHLQRSALELIQAQVRPTMPQHRKPMHINPDSGTSPNAPGSSGASEPVVDFSEHMKPQLSAPWQDERVSP